ncbi:MAG: ABC transporter substrate-binding protein, partial [Gemmatimonadales bacterium]
MFDTVLPTRPRASTILRPALLAILIGFPGLTACGTRAERQAASTADRPPQTDLGQTASNPAAGNETAPTAAPGTAGAASAVGGTSSPANAGGAAGAQPQSSSGRSTGSAAGTGASSGPAPGNTASNGTAPKGNKPASPGTPAPPPAPTPGAVPGPLRGQSPAVIASVGTISGPAGAALGGSVQALQVWSKAVNARGGINGHPVQLIVYDDGGDPARHRS